MTRPETGTKTALLEPAPESIFGKINARLHYFSGNRLWSMCYKHKIQTHPWASVCKSVSQSWSASFSGKTPVSGQRSFAVLRSACSSVSYTHLTLPTNREV